MNNVLNVTTMNNIDHQLLEQATCRLKWSNVVEMLSNQTNNQNVWGWKTTRLLSMPNDYYIIIIIKCILFLSSCFNNGFHGH
jgi:hypothetical protein